MLPSPDKFLNIVAKMRNAQKRYLKSHLETDFQEAERLEKKVDDAIDALYRNKDQKLLMDRLDRALYG